MTTNRTAAAVAVLALVLAWNGAVLATTVYLVGWQGWSAWWFLLALVLLLAVK